MKRFAALYDAIDGTTSTNAKVAAMVKYFGEAPAADAAWAIFFLTGRRLKRLVPAAAIRDWTLAATGLDPWLLEESYSVVGDGAETAALVLDQIAVRTSDDVSLAGWVEGRILPLRDMDPATQQARVSTWWGTLDRLQRFLLLKILTGELRVGVAQTLVVRALAHTAGLPVTTIAARMMGDWAPSAEWLASLLSHEHTDDDRSRPYPFFLASPLDSPVEMLGPREDWMVEWKWDGIRAQLVRRAGAVHLWSRGEELITHRFPEIAAAATHLPDGTVLDGEVLAFRDQRPLPFAALQQRIGRQKQVAQMVRAVPVVFMAYDLLEDGAVDQRPRPLEERRGLLEGRIGAASVLRTSEIITASTWEELAERRVAIARARRRRADVEAAVVAVCGRPAPGRLVEVEDRSIHHRRGSDLRAARQRPTRQPAHRLHVRRLEQRRAGTDRQGLLGALKRGNRRTGQMDSPTHARTLRSGPPRRAGPRI